MKFNLQQFAINNTGKNAMLDALGTQNGYASLHTAAPASAANELTATGSPAYARKAITWAAASGGSKALNGTLPTFDVYAGASVACVGFCASGVRGTSDINADDDVTTESFAGQGTYTLTSGTVSLT
jgi:hypothetical protein